MARVPTEPDPLAAEAQPIFGATVLTGVLAGFIAGMSMLAFAIASHWALDNGASTPLLEISCVLHGPKGMLGGGPEATLGFLIHSIVSASWGIVFAALFPRRGSPWTALWTGTVFGVAVWAVMTYGVLPWANETMSVRVSMLPEWFFYEHLAFGATLFVLPLLRRRLVPAEAREIRRTLRSRQPLGPLL